MRTAVLGNAPDRHRIPASAAVRRVGGGPVVAPGEATAIVAACGALPFALGGRTFTQPAGEGVRLVPAHADHRLLGPETVAPVFVVPEARSDDPVRRTPRPACLVPDPAFQVEAIADEGSKLRVGDGGLADLVGGGGGAPARMLVLLSFRRVASHPEPARRDGAVPHASHGNTKGARPGKQVKKGDGAARRPAGAAWRRRLRPGWHAGGLPRRPRGQRERDAGQAGPSAARPRRHLRIHRRRGGTPDPPLARPHPRRAVSRSGPALARGVREARAVLTNKPGGFAREILRGLEVEGAFRAVVGGDEGPRKPAPEGLLALCAALDLAPAQVLLVGDSVVDLATARAAGVRVCAVTWGMGERAALASADYLCDTPSELGELLGRLAT